MPDKAPTSAVETLLGGEVKAEIGLPVMEWKDFLENVPPGNKVLIKEALARVNTGSLIIQEPDLTLYCYSEKCNRSMDFRCVSRNNFFEQDKDVFLVYVCKNCEEHFKKYALNVMVYKKGYLAFKYGEQPSFGPPVPSKTLKLLGGDRELFLKGRRCENQGLGIAAFSYYRRVVENQRNQIFDQIIKVANKITNDPELIKELESSKKETQFTKSIESIKHALPQTLLIAGENPLLLLHSALSEGLHAKADSECLELATHIRTILDALAEKASMALKDDEALTSAVLRLKKAKGGGSKD